MCKAAAVAAAAKHGELILDNSLSVSHKNKKSKHQHQTNVYVMM